MPSLHAPSAQQFSFRFPVGEYSPAQVSHLYHVQSARTGARVALGLRGLEDRLAEEGLLNSEGLLGRDPDPQVWPSKVENGGDLPSLPEHRQLCPWAVLGTGETQSQNPVRTGNDLLTPPACTPSPPPRLWFFQILKLKLPPPQTCWILQLCLQKKSSSPVQGSGFRCWSPVH